MRFAIKLIEKVSSVIKEYATEPFILGYRISPEEVSQPGITIEDTLKFIDIIADKPLDYLHVSQRYVWRTSSNIKNGTEPLILKIKKQLKGRLPLIGVGAVATPEQAEEVILRGIDFVALGREFLIEPRWLDKVNTENENQIKYEINMKNASEVAINPAMWKYITTNPNDDPRNLIKDIKNFRKK